jgi:beta-lactamase superfamily II metal-dependent hydrolase
MSAAAVLVLLAGVAAGCSMQNGGNMNTGKELTITCFKAGKADAFALTTSSGTAMIDTGLKENSADLEDFLNEQQITKIDDLIVTHFDKDHVGGAAALVMDYQIGKVYTTWQSKDSDEITEFCNALSAKKLGIGTTQEDTSFTLDGVTYAIYPPEQNAYDTDESNNSSLAVRVSYGSFSMLFTGDAENERIKELVATPGLESTVLKVPYHGHWQDGLTDFVKYVSPEYAVITSSGAVKEDQETMDLLEHDGAEVYLTRKGTVTIVTDGSSVKITQH